MTQNSIEQMAIEARRAYQREWRKANPDKVKANAMRYWAKRAMKEAEERKAAEQEAN